MTLAVIEESNTEHTEHGVVSQLLSLACFCLPLETYNIHLSSITTAYYNVRIFELCRQTDSKNKRFPNITFKDLQPMVQTQYSPEQK